jgi:hypothetical protein
VLDYGGGGGGGGLLGLGLYGQGRFGQHIGFGGFYAPKMPLGLV